jgi:hypothetical protein
MQKFEVGKLFQEGVTKAEEGTKFNFDQSGASLYLFFNMPTDREVEEIRAGRFEIGIYQKDEVIFILFKIAGGSWMDAPYTVHLSQSFDLEEIQEGQGFGLTILLVDSSTGILKVIRQIGLGTDISRRLKEMIEKQKSQPFDQNVYQRKITQIYGNYNTDDLVQRMEVSYRVK